MNDKERRIEAERLKREQDAVASNKRKLQEEEQQRKTRDAERRAREKQEEQDRQRKQREQAQDRKKQQAKQSGAGSCFVGSTLILTLNGWQRISNLKQGDQVVSFDKSTSATSVRQIIRFKVHKPAVIWEVHLKQGEGPICTTKSHSFLTNRGWQKTNQLRTGDVMTTVGGHQAEVASVVVTNRTEAVFNLFTEVEHTFVAEGCVVHNFTYFRNLRIWWHKYLLSWKAGEPQNCAVVLN